MHTGHALARKKYKKTALQALLLCQSAALDGVAVYHLQCQSVYRRMLHRIPYQSSANARRLVQVVFCFFVYSGSDYLVYVRVRIKIYKINIHKVEINKVKVPKFEIHKVSKYISSSICCSGHHHTLQTFHREVAKPTEVIINFRHFGMGVTDSQQQTKPTDKTPDQEKIMFRITLGVYRTLNIGVAR